MKGINRNDFKMPAIFVTTLKKRAEQCISGAVDLVW